MSMSEMPPMAYLPESQLTAPELKEDGQAWIQVYGEDELDHPFSHILFLGRDARGDYLPCK